jgi:hypothetical protein
LPLFLVGTTLLAQTKLRDTMPATYPETVADDVKLDILTHLLHSNGFPAGVTELKLDRKQLENIPIIGKGARDIPNFALVEVVGCLEPSWTHTKATEPIITKEETTFAPESKPFGTQNYVLVSVAAFKPASQMLSPTCAD